MQVAGRGPYPQGPLGLSAPSGAGHAATQSSCCQDNHCLGPAQQGLRGWCLAPQPQSGRGRGFPSDWDGGRGALIRRGLGVYCPEKPEVGSGHRPSFQTNGPRAGSYTRGTGPDHLLPPAKAPRPAAPPYGRAEEHHLLYSLHDSRPLHCPFKRLVARRAGRTVPPAAGWWGRKSWADWSSRLRLQKKSPVRRGLTAPDGWPHSSAEDLETLEAETQHWLRESREHLPAPTSSPAPGPPPLWILKGPAGRGGRGAELQKRRAGAAPGQAAGAGRAGPGMAVAMARVPAAPRVR